jgi:hypothetical protein
MEERMATKIIQLHEHRKGAPRMIFGQRFTGPDGATIEWVEFVGVPGFTGWYYRRSAKTATGSQGATWGPFKTREEAETNAQLTANNWQRPKEQP